MDYEISHNIAERYSVRSYSDRPVSDEDVMAIVDAATEAPSSKNRQPWHYYIVRGQKKQDLVADMRKEIEASLAICESRGLTKDLRGAMNTMRIMDEAPVLLIVTYNDRYERPSDGRLEWTGMAVRELVDVLSIGASVENAVLEATERGLGSLWIGDFLYAPRTVSSIEGIRGHVVSMVSIGYASNPKDVRRMREDLFDVL